MQPNPVNASITVANPTPSTEGQSTAKWNGRTVNYEVELSEAFDTNTFYSFCIIPDCYLAKKENTLRISCFKDSEESLKNTLERLQYKYKKVTSFEDPFHRLLVTPAFSLSKIVEIREALVNKINDSFISVVLNPFLRNHSICLLNQPSLPTLIGTFSFDGANYELKKPMRLYTFDKENEVPIDRIHSNCTIIIEKWNPSLDKKYTITLVWCIHEHASAILQSVLEPGDCLDFDGCIIDKETVNQELAVLISDFKQVDSILSKALKENHFSSDEAQELQELLDGINQIKMQMAAIILTNKGPDAPTLLMLMNVQHIVASFYD